MGKVAITDVSLMTETEARACIDRIKASMEDMQAVLLMLQERRGYKALGYKSFHACIAAEFQLSEAHAYRLLTAARVNRSLGEAGPIPEAHARELATIAAPERQAVHAEVMEATQGKPTAAAYRQAVRPVPKPRSSRHPMVNHAYESADPFPERTACQCGCIHGCHD